MAVEGKKEKLADIRESIKIAEYSASMVEFLVAHKDEKLAEIDAKMEELRKERQTLCDRIARAPQDLAANKHQIEVLRKKESDLLDVDGKRAKIKNLKEQMEKIKKELDSLGK